MPSTKLATMEELRIEIGAQASGATYVSISMPMLERSMICSDGYLCNHALSLDFKKCIASVCCVETGSDSTKIHRAVVSISWETIIGIMATLKLRFLWEELAMERQWCWWYTLDSQIWSEVVSLADWCQHNYPTSKREGGGRGRRFVVDVSDTTMSIMNSCNIETHYEDPSCKLGCL